MPGPTLGALALVRPEYLAIGFLLALIVLLRERLTFGRRRALLSAAIVAAGIVVVVAPWTVAQRRRASIASSPSPTGGGQVLYAGTYLPSEGNPEKVGAAVVERNPALFGPHALENLRLEQILARLAEDRYPELEPDQALSKMGKEQLRNDLTHHLGEYVEFVAKKIGRIWSPRPPCGDARAGLGGPPLGPPRPRPPRPRPPRLATPLGGTPDRRRLPCGHPDQCPPGRLPRAASSC